MDGFFNYSNGKIGEPEHIYYNYICTEISIDSISTTTKIPTLKLMCQGEEHT